MPKILEVAVLSDQITPLTLGTKIVKTIAEEKIDLLVMLAHQEGHVEHFLFGRSTEELVRKMPCSILLVKKEPEPAVDNENGEE